MDIFSWLGKAGRSIPSCCCVCGVEWCALTARLTDRTTIASVPDRLASLVSVDSLEGCFFLVWIFCSNSQRMPKDVHNTLVAILQRHSTMTYVLSLALSSALPLLLSLALALSLSFFSRF